MDRRCQVLEQLVKQTSYLSSLSSSDPSPTFMREYCLFKLGFPPVRERFLKELAELVALERGESIVTQPNSWRVVTAATFEVALEFARMLSVELQLPHPLLAVNVGAPASPATEYSDCSLAERQQKAADFYHYPTKISGQQFILIDDLLNTGTAIAALAECLLGQGARPTDIYSYVFVRAHFSDPTDERRLVQQYVSEYSPETLAQLVNHKRYYRTSATMYRTLSQLSNSDATRFLAALKSTRLRSMKQDAARYYGNGELPEIFSHYGIAA